MPRKKVTKKMGVGTVFQKEYRDRDGRVRLASTYTIQYYKHGKRIRESAKTEDREEAMDLLRTRLSDVHHDRPTGPSVDNTTFEDLEQLIVDDYTMNDQDLRVLQVCRLPPLRRAFGGWRARNIDESAILKYCAARKREKKLVGGKHKTKGKTTIAISTINRELTTLGRMFSLAFKARKVARVPTIERYTEHNTRQGFVELADIEAAKKHVRNDDASIKALIDIGFITGWRMDSELMERKWSDVDLRAGELRLPVGVAKDPEGRVFPLLPHLKAVIEKQREYVKAIEQREKKTIPWMFVRPSGQRIITCKKAIRAAFKEAGLPKFLPHDFRRSAVRSLELAGVPRPAAKKMVGHKTDSVYERYAIADKRMIDVGSAKLQAYLESQAKSEDAA